MGVVCGGGGVVVDEEQGRALADAFEGGGVGGLYLHGQSVWRVVNCVGYRRVRLMLRSTS